MFVSAFIFLTIILIINIIRRKISVFYLFYSVVFLIFFISGRQSLKQSELLRQLNAEGVITCSIEGKVDKAIPSDYGYRLFLSKVRAKGYGSVENCIVYSDSPAERGSTIRAEGTAKLIKRATNPGEFDLREYYEKQKIGYFFYSDSLSVTVPNQNPLIAITNTVSAHIEKSVKSICNEPYASTICAILLGRKDLLDEDIYGLFSACGIGHILAISGLHISMLGISLYRLLKRLGRGDIFSMAVGVTVIIMYGIMTGNATSTVRATIMYAALVTANIYNRTYDMLSAASLAAIIMAIRNPAGVESSAFILSYSAVLGVCVVSRVVCDTIRPRKKILNALLASVSIQLSTVPVIMYYYYEVPVLAVFLNLIVIPLMSVLMYSSLAGSILGLVSINLGKIAIIPAVAILKVYEILCTLNLKIPWARFVSGKPPLWKIALYYAILGSILLAMYLRKKRWLATLILLPCLFIFIRISDKSRIVFLDVGQGDGIYIAASDGTKILMDCGSSDRKKLYENILEPFLLSSGVDRLNYIIVTHPDTDHISGITELLSQKRIRADTLCLPYTLNKDEKYIELETAAAARGMQILYLCEGMEIRLKDTVLTCLHPFSDNSGTGFNEMSVVISLKQGDFGALFTGDLPGTSDEAVVRVLPFSSYHVLKVAHHGSKNSSSSDFLSAVNPQYAVISCGEGNSYGHPHEETLKRLEEVGAGIYRTDCYGAIILTFSSVGEVKMEGYGR